MEPLHVGVILASVREGRRGESFAKWIVTLASARPELSVRLLDLREWAIGPYAHKDSPPIAEKTYAQGSLAQRWGQEIASLDAFVVVTPEYSHGYPGALKNALDVVYAPWHHKPVGFVSYGGFAAGARAVEQLRLVAVELRLVPIRDEVNVRLIGYQADEQGFPKEEVYGKRAAAMLDELTWWARVVKDGRANHKR
jgi:NAD(P)H-dependent FMN reductase